MALLEMGMIILIIVSALYGQSFIISISSKDYEKFTAYECGFEPFHTNARIKFEVIYWVIAILYLIFDQEIVLVFPQASIIYTLNSVYPIIIYIIFMIIQTLGFVYEYLQGTLKFN